MLVYNLITLASVGLIIWAVIWSHLAFKRWEEREDAKVAALEKIASKMSLQPSTSPRGQRESTIPEWSATR